MGAIELSGPRKIYPRADGERIKFVFVNKTGEDIYDMWIVTGSPGFTPEIKKIDIRLGADEVEFEDGLEPGDESDNVHLTLMDEIPKDAQFSITIDFDEDFDDDEWIRFSPSDENDATIVTEGSLSSDSEFQQVAIAHRVKRIKRNSARETAIVARRLREMGPRHVMAALAEIEASKMGSKNRGGC